MNEHNSELNRIKSEYEKRDTQPIRDSYKYTNPAFLFNIQERERVLLKLLRQASLDLAKSDVLEVGCGSGHILQRFLEFGAPKATGIDFLENRIKEAIIKYPNIKFITGDASSLPFEAESFHLVLNFMCLSSITDTSMREKVMSEMWRVLKKGGVVLSYDIRPIFGPIKWLSKIYYNSRKDLPNPETPLYHLKTDDYRRCFPNGKLYCKSLSLLPKLANLSERAYGLTYFLSLIPLLQTHYLIAIQKT